MNNERYARYGEIINDICQKQTPGKKKVQKLLYLIERKGVDLNLNYSIHFYGPYSAILDDALHTLEVQGIINILTSKSTHEIRVVGSEQLPETLDLKEKQIVEEVLDFFGDKTASELEALTTIDYVAHTLLQNSNDMDEVLNDVVKIKGKKFKKVDLEQEYHVLQKMGFLNKVAEA